MVLTRVASDLRCLDLLPPGSLCGALPPASHHPHSLPHCIGLPHCIALYRQLYYLLHLGVHFYQQRCGNLPPGTHANSLRHDACTLCQLLNCRGCRRRRWPSNWWLTHSGRAVAMAAARFSGPHGRQFRTRRCTAPTCSCVCLCSVHTCYGRRRGSHLLCCAASLRMLPSQAILVSMLTSLDSPRSWSHSGSSLAPCTYTLPGTMSALMRTSVICVM